MAQNPNQPFPPPNLVAPQGGASASPYGQPVQPTQASWQPAPVGAQVVPQQTPVSQQQAPAPQENSFGFETPAAPKNEKYNTQFIVARMEKDRKATTLMVVGGIVAIIFAIALFVIFRPDSALHAPPKEQNLDTPAPPAAAADTKPLEPTASEKPAEAASH